VIKITFGSIAAGRIAIAVLPQLALNPHGSNMRPAYLIWGLTMLLQPTVSVVGGHLLASPGATTCGELADKYRLNPELSEAVMVLWEKASCAA
jgi:hypothetical protein